jgi:flagellar motor switch protein FliN/FliY
MARSVADPAQLGGRSADRDPDHRRREPPVSLAEELETNADFALAFTAALTNALNAETPLTVGERAASIPEVLGEQAARFASADFTFHDGQDGTIVLAAFSAFAQSLDRAADDETLVTAVQPAFEGAIRSAATTAGTEADVEAAVETDLATINAAHHSDTLVVYPVVAGDDVVGCVALYLLAEGADEAAGPATPGDARAALAPRAGPEAFVLADVEMGVTAELGRCRMTMRELLSITPGAVIDLDRAASAPVDVLVNGTLIARGEVVVIEEEFGIRISEILPEGAPHQ